MENILYALIKKTPFYQPLRNWCFRNNQLRDLEAWESKGRPVPPPHMVKQKVIRSYAHKYGLKVLVESGTYYGDMVEAMKQYFEKVYSIELSPALFTLAQRRFRNDKNVELLCGDSGKQLDKLLRLIDQPTNQPTLFWLDGHFSGGVTAKAEVDTPILEELSTILTLHRGNMCIIIDDARCFGTDPAYPSIDKLRQYVQQKRPDFEIAVEDDSIRITPKVA